jgi:ABC-type Na+ transport system ATPase subunit NatA
LDLLGVDEDGRLVVFELKRGELTRLAVAQVLDYASSLNGLETSDLSDRITEMSGRGGTEKLESFATWYEENYNEALADIGRPRMVLVGLGVDAAAKRIVEFLTQANLDISLITFYGFRQNGETFLARQVEVEARGPAQVARASKAENQAKLRQRLQETGLEDIYGKLQTILERPRRRGFSLAEC